MQAHNKVLTYINHYTDFLKFGIWQKFGYTDFLKFGQKSKILSKSPIIIITNVKRENSVNRLKIHLSDGIQEAVSTKKKRKSAQNSPFGWYPGSRFYKKEKKKVENQLNSPSGLDPRSRSNKKEEKNYILDSSRSRSYKKKRKSAQNSPFGNPFIQKRKKNKKIGWYLRSRFYIKERKKPFLQKRKEKRRKSA